MLTLDQVKAQSVATIISVDDSPFRAKLADMGIGPDQLVKVLYKAPLGDPIAMEVGDYVLSLRKKEAAKITVKLEGEAHR
ncbi:MAG: FeoA family protein [Bacteroidota bacterium]